MTMEPLTIHVDAEAARAYRTASPERQRKLDALLSMHLRKATSTTTPSLRDVIDEISRNAQARGLTPEILQSIRLTVDGPDGDIADGFSTNPA